MLAFYYRSLTVRQKMCAKAKNGVKIGEPSFYKVQPFALIQAKSLISRHLLSEAVAKLFCTMLYDYSSPHFAFEYDHPVVPRT